MKQINKLIEDLQEKIEKLKGFANDYSSEYFNARIYQAKEDLEILNQIKPLIEKAKEDLERRMENIIDRMSNFREGAREYCLEDDEEFANNFDKDMENFIKELHEIKDEILGGKTE